MSRRIFLQLCLPATGVLLAACAGAQTGGSVAGQAAGTPIPEQTATAANAATRMPMSGITPAMQHEHAVTPTSTSATLPAAPAATSIPAPVATQTGVSAQVATQPAPAQLAVGRYTTSKEAAGTYIFGFLTNPTSAAMELLQVVATMLDGQGRTVATATGFDARGVIPPGERSPFALLVNPGIAWVKEQITMQAQPAEEQNISHYATGLTLSSLSATPPDAAANRPYRIAGLVNNGGPHPAMLVEIYGIAYDANDTPLDVNNANAKADLIDPGEAARFVLELHRLKAAPARYELYVQGHIPH